MPWYTVYRIPVQCKNRGSVRSGRSGVSGVGVFGV